MSSNTLASVYAVMAVLWSMAADYHLPDATSAGISAFLALAFIGGAVAHKWIDSHE